MSQRSAKVSIVIATYNRKASLKECIESIFLQTVRDVEIIIVDDGSTDGTKEWIQEEYRGDPRVKCFFLGKNNGPSVARNRGITEASGRFILVWDSDDQLFPKALEVLLEKFEQYPECAVVSAPAILKRGSEVIRFLERTEGFISVEKLICRYLPHNEKVRLVRSSVMKEVRYVSRNIDFVVGPRLANRGPWFHVNEPLGEVSVDGPDSLTRKRRSFDPIRSMDRSKHLLSFLQEFGDTMRENCPEYYASHAYGASLGLFLDGDEKNSRYYARAALKNGPIKLRRVMVFLLTHIPYSHLVRKFLFRSKPL